MPSWIFALQKSSNCQFYSLWSDLDLNHRYTSLKQYLYLLVFHLKNSNKGLYFMENM